MNISKKMFFCIGIMAFSFLDSVKSEECKKQKIIEEPSSSALILELPEKSILEGYIIGQKKICILNAESLNLDVQCWFRHQKAGRTDYFKKRKTRWNELISATQVQAAETLKAIETDLQTNIGKAQQKLRDSEHAFYAKKPTLTISGNYCYEEGKREQNNEKNSWKFDPQAVISNESAISCDGSFDSKKVVFKVAGEETPMIQLQVTWSTSFSCNLTNQVKIKIPENENSPNIRVFCSPVMKGKCEWHFEVKESYLEQKENAKEPVPIKIAKTRLSGSPGWYMLFKEEKYKEIPAFFQAGKSL